MPYVPYSFEMTAPRSSLASVTQNRVVREREDYLLAESAKREEIIRTEAETQFLFLHEPLRPQQVLERPDTDVRAIERQEGRNHPDGGREQGEADPCRGRKEGEHPDGESGQDAGDA